MGAVPPQTAPERSEHRREDTAMDAHYEAYCMADPHFYDRFDSHVTDERLFPPLREAATPQGWQRVMERGWVHYQPSGVLVPSQGWKVHVSAAADRATEVAQKVFDYCVGHTVMFKLVPSAAEYVRRNGKYGERAGSGKLATIYPLGEPHLRTIVTELGTLLEGIPGPYILSDLRWQDGPVYVRYGAFAPRTVKSADGRETGAIEDPDGNLVPDPRGPVFSVPDWVSLPDFLRPQLELRNAARVDSLPVDIVDALHYSNGGGVYEGRDKATGEKVAVKEGRPHAAVDRAGRDAVTRLRRERDILRRLEGLPAVPALKGYYSAAGHEFMVEEFVPGEPLFAACSRRNPVVEDTPASPERIAGFRDWAMSTWDRVAEAVRAMHRRGVVFGDLHMHNIFCPTREEEAAGEQRIRLIDFEGGWFLEEGGEQVMANSGFVAPPGATGTSVDEYALAALKLAIFAPMTSMLRLNEAKAAHLAALITDRFAVPREWFADALPLLRRGRVPDAAPRSIDLGTSAWKAVRRSMAEAIRVSASPERTDRVFPGDIAQFLQPGSGLGMAHGAAGVLWALRAAGAEETPVAERWLLDRIREDAADIRPGFYSGWHGIAHALWELGQRDAAVDILARQPEASPGDQDLSLSDGLAGMGLNWLHFARECGESQYLTRALDAADLLCHRLAEPGDTADISGGLHSYAGLMQGSSGPALFLTAVFEETGEHRYLDSAGIALRQDLRRCTRSESGQLYVNEGYRLMPYVATGSAGVGIALDRYLMSRSDAELEAELSAIRRATRTSFCLFSGLFEGLAGLVLFNASHQAADPHAAAALVSAFDWHVLDWKGLIAFPGAHLLRMSMDLATGSAGVLLALAAVHAAETQPRRRLSLPFLLPPKISGPALGARLSPATTTPERR